MSLLPSKPDAEPAEDAGPRVIGVDDADADDVLAALSSGTARRLLAALHEDPAPPSELAERVDTSLQNVQYHLGKLENAGAIEVVETAYSAKGREMDVYAPSDQPLVIFAGDEERGSTLRTALQRLVGAVGLLALGSLLVQALFDDGAQVRSGGDGVAPTAGSGDGGDGGGAANVSFETTQTATEAEDVGIMATETPVRTATETPQATETPMQATPETVDAVRQAGQEGAAGLPPGVLFFAGGLFVLAVIAGVWYLGRRRA